MTGAGFADGDWAVVRAQPDAGDGEIVAAMIGGEATVRTLRRAGGRTWLTPHDHVPGTDATIIGTPTPRMTRMGHRACTGRVPTRQVTSTARPTRPCTTGTRACERRTGMATTHIRHEAVLGPVRSVVLDDETGSRATRTTYSLNVLDGWVHERERTDESGLVWEASSPCVQSAVRAVLDAAPECAEFIAESHLLWIEALRQAGQARRASAQRRALDDALRHHGLALAKEG
jgi:hypothetical protein